MSRPIALFLLLLALGCDSATPPASNQTSGTSDVEKVLSADFSILFVGNSHTMMHDIPGLTAKMIQFRHPEKIVYTHTLGVGFLEEVANQPRFKEELESRPWKFVVLQAQKISMSGKFQYSKQEGIDFAKAAKERGATVFFYSEWGRKDVPGDGVTQEKINQHMADESGSRVAAIGRAWDLALAERPELPLHDFDGNHQSSTGAFLTACVFYGLLTCESPAELATFSYSSVNDADRRFLAEIAARSLK